MVERIKLENVIGIPQEHKHDGIDYGKNSFCPKCGQKLIALSISEEYVCEKCRHLVQKDDMFCSFCGEVLSDSKKVEHYAGDSQIDEESFKKIKAKIV